MYSGKSSGPQQFEIIGRRPFWGATEEEGSVNWGYSWITAGVISEPEKQIQVTIQPKPDHVDPTHSRISAWPMLRPAAEDGTVWHDLDFEVDSAKPLQSREECEAFALRAATAVSRLVEAAGFELQLTETKGE